MNIHSLGWDTYVTNTGADTSAFSNVAIGRVIAENKNNWIVSTDQGECQAIISRNFTLKNPVPKAGDWVTYQQIENDNAKLRITSVLPRFSTLSRSNPSPEAKSQDQILAVNVDIACIVQGLDANFNENRLERYLVMIQQGGAKPGIILNKTDLAQDIASVRESMQKRFNHIPVFFISAQTGQGIRELAESFVPGKTMAFLGSSGVGKSTLLNALLGSNTQTTAAVREQDSRGRHTTTRRELFILPHGSMVIDTPGMRELQISADTENVKDVFARINALAKQCEFPDCDHEHSKGCVILKAVETGELNTESYKSFIKLRREAEFNESKDRVAYQQTKKQFWKSINKFQKLRIKLEDKEL